jgi:hypothetical protein
VARSYGKLMSSIWRDEDFKRLPNAETQLLYLALISQPDLSPCGRLTVALGRWADGIAGADRHTVTASLEELEAARFIVVDWDNDELLVRSFVRHDNGLGNPRRRAAIRNAAQEVGSPRLRATLRAENPGVFDDKLQDIHRPDAKTAESDKSPGQSSNVQRTSPEPTVCTSMPNQGTVSRETGTVIRDPESGTNPSSSKVTQPGAETTKKDQIIDAIVDIRANGQTKGPKWRQTVAADVEGRHGSKIDQWLEDFPRAPVDVIAGALESGDSRSLTYWRDVRTSPPEPARRLSAEERAKAMTDAGAPAKFIQPRTEKSA